MLGPVNSVAEALELLDHGGADAAVLDVTLGQETSEPVARRLLASSIPFVTCSGYSRSQLPGAYVSAPLIGKPLNKASLIDWAHSCV